MVDSFAICFCGFTPGSRWLCAIAVWAALTWLGSTLISDRDGILTGSGLWCRYWTVGGQVATPAAGSAHQRIIFAITWNHRGDSGGGHFC